MALALVNTRRLNFVLMLEQLALVKHKNQQKSCQIFDMAPAQEFSPSRQLNCLLQIPHAVDIDQG